MLRVGFFIDGQFMAKISASYADIFKRGSIFIPKFCETIELCLQDFSQDRVVTSERHYFRGNMNLTDKNRQQLINSFDKDKKTHDVLVSNLFDIHEYPLAFKNGEYTEKCIDTMMAVEIVEAASQGRLDIVVLISGDADILPALLKCKRYSVVTVCLELDGNNHEKVARVIDSHSDFSIKMSKITDRANIFVKKPDYNG